MDKSEPSLVPEWLRSTGGGSSSHHFPSSQADGPVLALPKRNRPSKSVSTSVSSILEQGSSPNFRRSSSTNGAIKHDKNSNSRPYSSFNRSLRDRDRERLNIADNWDLEYSDPLRSMVTGKTEDTLRRSQSMISRRPGEVLPKRFSTDLNNGSNNIHDSGNGSHSAGSGVSGLQKVSFEMDFPLLGSEERPKTPKTPDIVRVSSPGLSRVVQSLSIGNSQVMGSEIWTSALAEVPAGAGSNTIGLSSAAQAPITFSGANSTSSPGNTPSGLNMAEALVQAPAKTHNIPQPSGQTQRDELAIAQSKKLIPMTPVLPKTLTVNASDKLKPKAAVRSADAAVTPKNGSHQSSPLLQLGSQSARVPSGRVDSPKSSSSGKLLVLKPGRENGAHVVSKDIIQSQTTNVNSKFANGQPASSPPVSLTNTSNSKLSSSDRKSPTFILSPVAVAEKRPSHSQARSRHDFFNLMRNKSINNGSGGSDSGRAVSSDTVDKSDKDMKELPSVQVTPGETENEVQCDIETYTSVKSLSHCKKNGNEVTVYPVEEEEAFLRSLGWDDNASDDEGLTEEEINAFYKEVMRLRATSKLCRGGMWMKILSHCEIHASTEQSPSPN